MKIAFIVFFAVVVVTWFALWLRCVYLILQLAGKTWGMKSEERYALSSLIFTPLRDADDKAFSVADREIIRLAHKIQVTDALIFGLTICFLLATWGVGRLKVVAVSMLSLHHVMV